MTLVLLHGKGPMPFTDRDVPAFAGSATRFEDSPAALALPFPKGFEPPSPDIKRAICLEILKCIENLPSTTCTEMKDDLCSSTEFVNWTNSPSSETSDIKLAFCEELGSCLDSLPSNIREVMVSYLASSPELTEYLFPPIPTMSSNPEEVPEGISTELVKYLATLPSATSELIRTGVMIYISSTPQNECPGPEAFRQAVCTELLKCVNSLPSPAREEMITSLLSQAELMRYLDAPLRTTPSSTSTTMQHTKTAVSPSTNPQQMPQRVEHDEKEVEITEKERREMVAIAEAESENSKLSPSPSHIWDQCAAKRPQSPLQQHDNQPPKSQAPRVDKYGREQPPLHATPSEIWGARAKLNSPPQNNNRQPPNTETREVDRYGNPQPDRNAAPAKIWRAKARSESPPKNNNRPRWRTETLRKDKYGRVQPPTNATPAEIWGAKANNHPDCPRRVTG